MYVLLAFRCPSRPSTSCARRNSSDTLCSRASRRYVGQVDATLRGNILNAFLLVFRLSCLPPIDRSGPRCAVDSAVRPPRAGLLGRSGGKLPRSVPHGAGGLFRRDAGRVRGGRLRKTHGETEEHRPGQGALL